MHSTVRRQSSKAFRRAFLAVLGLCTFAACGKKEAALTTTTSTTGTVTSAAAMDTSVKVEEMAITDSAHRLFFRPQVGTTQRFHVVDKMTADVVDQQPNGQKANHGGSSTTEYYIRQTVKSVNAKDSSVELTFRVDSIMLRAVQDTQKVDYSSSRPADRSSDKYREFNIILGKDFTIKTNKYGDLNDIVDVSSLTTSLIATVPDSVKKDPRVKQMANQQAQQLVNTYVVRVLAHSPTRVLKKDTTWTNKSDVNLDVAPGMAFPVTVDAKETVKGLEKRGDKTVVVLEDNTTTTPKKTVFQEGPTKATISNFLATSHAFVRIDDATGILFHRTLEEKRGFTFVVESKQQPNQKRTLQQSGSESMTVELLQ